MVEVIRYTSIKKTECG